MYDSQKASHVDNSRTTQLAANIQHRLWQCQHLKLNWTANHRTASSPGAAAKQRNNGESIRIANVRCWGGVLAAAAGGVVEERSTRLLDQRPRGVEQFSVSEPQRPAERDSEAEFARAKTKKHPVLINVDGRRVATPTTADGWVTVGLLRLAGSRALASGKLVEVSSR